MRYVLEGSVCKASNRVRITAHLIEAETSAHLWADRFDGSLEDIFELQGLAAKQRVAIGRQPPFDIIGIARDSCKAGVQHGLRDTQAERPARLDEGKDGEDLIIAENCRECRHSKGGTGRLGSEATIFGLVEEVFVGVLPSVAGLIMRWRASSSKLVVKLPQRLAL